MHVLSAAIGIAMLLLVGIAAVLTLVLLVLYLVRQVTRMSHSINQPPTPTLKLVRPPLFSWETGLLPVDADEAAVIRQLAARLLARDALHSSPQAQER